MRRLSVVVAASVVCACAQTFPLKPAEGAAQIEWISASTFRYVRNWSGAGAAPAAAAAEPVAKMAEVEGRLRFTTRYLTVDVDKDGGRVEVRSDRGPLTALAISREGIEARAAAGERFYGLGSRRTAELDLRGQKVQATRPFLLSSAGYGMWIPRCPGCPFDFGADRWTARVAGERVEFNFYYGPTAKEVWEEHLGAVRQVDGYGATDLAIRLRRASAVAASWNSLRETVHLWQHESMSAMLTPSFDLAPYQAAGGELFTRAAQLGAYIPRLHAAPDATLDAMASWRTRLKPYLESYGYETHGRGTPLVHALAAHFARDAEGARRADEFMLGDELLLAPVLGPGKTMKVYLPQGQWTELHSNVRYAGRQEVAVEAPADAIPVFVRNGSIVPLAPASGDGPVELHYYPKLGGEFFLYEEDLADFTQVHAAPADEFLRLEIESKKDRAFEWVVHHTPACRRVAIGEKEFVRAESREKLAPGAWYYDAAAQSLHVRVRAAAGGDEIVNVTF